MAATFPGVSLRIARVVANFATCILAILLSLAPAAAEKRVALVIGNGAYKNASKLANPVNDAKAISGMLQSAGFDAVELHENLGIRELRRAINDFADIARDADTAVVYYSGHGIEVNGINYLIPVDAVLSRDTDVPYETFSLENLVQVLEPARRLRLVMLDACRDNPFVRTMKRTVGTRAVGRGLAAVEPTSVNTLIGFAAKAGSYALDGDGANSPYAIAVLNNLATPGLDLRIAFGRVRDEVLKSTKNKQEPFVYGSLGGTNVSIVDASATANAGTAPTTQVPVPSIDRAAQAWAATKDTTSIAILEEFIRHFGSTVYGSMARARLEELKKNQVAIVAPKSPVKPPASGVGFQQPTNLDTNRNELLPKTIRIVEHAFVGNFTITLQNVGSNVYRGTWSHGFVTKFTVTAFTKDSIKMERIDNPTFGAVTGSYSGQRVGNSARGEAAISNGFKSSWDASW